MPLNLRREAPPSRLTLKDLAPRAGVCVGIPAKNEEAVIGACLEALIRQVEAPDFSVFVYANDCDDATAEVVERIARDAPITIELCNVAGMNSPAPAALARRMCMNGAALMAGAKGVVLTTDADTVVDPTWIVQNLNELDNGADVVCGAVSPDIREMISLPQLQLQRGVAEFALETAQTELESRLDPLAWDPLPRHRVESAASLACSVRTLLSVDGVPVVQPGEDRVFVTYVRRAGGRVRHSPQVSALTSCRLDGRARGGWADELNERMRNSDAPCHRNLEPSLALFRRARLRGAMRAAWPHIDVALWSRRLRLAPESLRACLGEAHFEQAWSLIEEASPRLVYERVEAGDLARENERVQRLMRMLVRSRAEEAVAA